MMFNANNKKVRTPATPTPRVPSEIRRKEISDRLKIVDRLIKDNNLDEARAELDAVREMDPKNGYILALAERIEELIKVRDNPPPVEPKSTVDASASREAIERQIETEYLEKFADEVHKVEERLETEYRNTFTEEMGKAREEVAEFLKLERERHDTETAALIADFDREKGELLTEFKEVIAKLFDAEFKRADDSNRNLLGERLRKTEEKVGLDITAQYERAVAELRDVITKERTRVLDESRSLIAAEIKKQLDEAARKRAEEESAKVKAVAPPRSEEPKETELPRLEVDDEEKSDSELSRIGGQIGARLSDLEKASEERYRKSVEKARELPEKPLSKSKQNDSKNKTEIETTLAELQNDTDSEIKIKSDEQLARERELLEKLRAIEFKEILNGVNWKERPRKKK